MTNLGPSVERPGWVGSLRAVVFDCFGTLADFGDRHFIDAFDALAYETGLRLAGKELWDRWLEHGRTLAQERGRHPKDPLAGPEPAFALYRDTWTAQFARTFEPFGRSSDAAAACQQILEMLGQARCFPEVPAVLAALRPAFRLAVLSNADDDFLHACLQQNGLAFEVVVSSESARAYKPWSRIFHCICDELTLQPPEILYVGDSPIADVLGARAAGLPVAWINRGGSTLPERVPAPDVELPNLTGLAELLLSRGPYRSAKAPPDRPINGSALAQDRSGSDRA